MGVRLGLDAKLFLNGGTHGAPTWGEVDNVKDLTLNLEAGEADVTTRGNNGWRAIVATLKDASIEFEMVWNTADPNFATIRDAFLANGSIDVAVMDGDMDDGESEGLRATCMVQSFSRNEPLEEALTVSVSIKPTYSDNPPEWINGASSSSGG